MPTAELEKPVEEEQLVARPEDGTVYMSRRSDLRLLKTQTRNRYNAEGSVIETIQGECILFRDGVLRLPTRGKALIDKGMKVPVGELREWLEDHKSFGDREEGFWRVDPVAPPVGEVELERLTEITTDLDIPRLEAFIAQEEAGWAREKLLKAARAALERVQDAMTRLRAEERDAFAKAREEGRAEALETASKAQEDQKTAEPTAAPSKSASGVESAK